MELRPRLPVAAMWEPVRDMATRVPARTEGDARRRISKSPGALDEDERASAVSENRKVTMHVSAADARARYKDRDDGERTVCCFALHG